MKAATFLNDYRKKLYSLRTMQEALRNFGSDGRPNDIPQAVQMLEEKRQTNNKEAASVQSYQRLTERLQAFERSVEAMRPVFQQVLERLPDERRRLIFQLYYEDGQTDEIIGEWLFVCTRQANRLRNEAVAKLDKAGGIAWAQGI